MFIKPGTSILVTGATGGIGREIAAAAARAGAIVGVHGSRAESVASVMEDLRQQAPEGRFIAAPADYRQEGAIRAMVDRFVEQASVLDGVIDCAVAGVEAVTGAFRSLDPAVFGPCNAQAIGAVQLLVHAAIPHLAGRGGAIVAFASDSGRFAAPRQSMVGASRAGIIGFVHNIGVELAREGIRVNCISPSFVVDTPIFERFSHAAEGRAAEARKRAGLGLPSPADIAPLALFLVGPHSSRITGQVISVNGGLNA